MKKVIMAMLTAAVLTACTSSNHHFSRMNELELAEYNQTVGFWDRVHCTSDIRIGSHIRKTTCLTYEQMADYNLNQIGRVNAIAAGGTLFR